MKYKSIQLVLALFFIVTSLQAQTTFLKGGLNISSVAGLQEPNSLVGYHFGVGGIKSFSENFSLKHEFIFSMQGTDASGGALRYYYLNMPVMIHVPLAQKLYLNTGPQTGIVISAMDKAESTNVTASLNTIDLSFGLGFQYSATERLFLDTRYNFGITNVYRNETSRNSVFQISAGYFLGSKKSNQ